MLGRLASISARNIAAARPLSLATAAGSVRSTPLFTGVQRLFTSFARVAPSLTAAGAMISQFTQPWSPQARRHIGYVTHRYAIPVHEKRHRLSKKTFLARNKRDSGVDKIRLEAMARWLPAAKGNLKRRRAGLGHKIHKKSRRQKTRLKKKVYASRKQLNKLKKTLPAGSLPQRR